MSDSATVAWDDGFEQLEMPLSEADVEELVSRLDGRDRTLVTVFLGEGHAACGGDAGSGVVAYVSLDGEHFHQLVEGDDDGEMEVVAGGQLGRYSVRSVVPAGRAIEALRWFAEHFELAPNLEWESS